MRFFKMWHGSIPESDDDENVPLTHRKKQKKREADTLENKRSVDGFAQGVAQKLILQSRPAKYVNDIARCIWGSDWHEHEKKGRLQTATTIEQKLRSELRIPHGVIPSLSPSDQKTFTEIANQLLRKKVDVQATENDTTEEAHKRAETHSRKQVAEEEARTKRAAEEEARTKRAAEEEARTKRAAEANGSEDFVMPDDEEGESDASISFDVLAKIFLEEYEKVHRPPNLTGWAEQLPAETFPLYDAGPPAHPSPLPIVVYRALSNSSPKPSKVHCSSALREQHFYIAGEQAILAGGTFREIFRQIKPVQRRVDPASASGYKDVQQNAMYVRNRGWLIPCTFIVGTKRGIALPSCELTRLPLNWWIAYRWHIATLRTNERVNAGRTSPLTLRMDHGARDKRTGVLGWDTPVTIQPWAKELLPSVKWSSPYFPKLDSDGRLTFHRGGQSCLTAESVIRWLKRKQPELWVSAFGDQIRDVRGMQAFMVDTDAKVALAAWGHHARLFVKVPDKHVINVYDPWKQKIVPPAWIRETLQNHPPWTLEFISRKADQAFGEGSCQLQAITRLLMAAQMGANGVELQFNTDRPDLFTYPIVTQLLVTRLRRRSR